MPAWIAREAVGSVAPDTPPGRLAAEAAGILASVVESTCNRCPSSCTRSWTSCNCRLTQQAEPEPRPQAELQRQAELERLRQLEVERYHQMHAEIEEPQLEAGG
jgi:hypothetical protein